jgi:hypothetical protein
VGSPFEAVDRETTHLGIDDVESRISRIVPLTFFIEGLRLRELVLTSPALWEDPFEFSRVETAMQLEPSMRQVSVTKGLPPMFAQSWSTVRDSDTLLRAYSRVDKDPATQRNKLRNAEGVRVFSTPRKLLLALRAGAANDPPASCYIGAVRYESKDSYLAAMHTAVEDLRESIFSTPRRRAEWLLRKRDAFAHEAEVRLMYVQHRARSCRGLYESDGRCHWSRPSSSGYHDGTLA